MSSYQYEKDIRTIQGRFDRIYQKYKITTGECIFISSFIINFVVGKIIHFTSQKEEVYNYYNDKNNVLNQVFVKKGWFWTTIVVVIFFASVLYTKHPKATKSGRVIRTAVINYAISTLWWILFTQWCFGLPIMDRIFLSTGGKCSGVDELRLAKHLPLFVKDEEVNLYESRVVGSGVCRSLKGQWTGGHDPSGHAFLLIHSSLYLFFEMLPYWFSWKLVVNNAKSTYTQVRNSDDTIGGKAQLIGKYFVHNPWIIVMGLISLWWFMLLMTNIYFHSILEKFVGLLFGYLISLLYLLPRHF